MTFVTIGVCLLTLTGVVMDDAADRAAVEAIVENVYETISFEPGSKADWDAFRALMAPGAILTPVRGGDVMTVEEFIASFEEVVKNPDNPFTKRGFVERQLNAVTEIYGGVAHVFTTYETTFADGGPIGRGINSMQLVRLKGKWLISSIAWDDEANSGMKIPANYLGEKK